MRIKAFFAYLTEKYIFKFIKSSVSFAVNGVQIGVHFQQQLGNICLVIWILCDWEILCLYKITGLFK